MHVVYLLCGLCLNVGIDLPLVVVVMRHSVCMYVCVSFNCVGCVFRS